MKISFKKARTLSFSLFYCLLISYSGFSQTPDMHPIVRSAYQDLLNLDIKSSGEKLNYSPKDPSENPYYIYVSNLAAALEVYISDSEETYDRLKGREDYFLETIDEMPDDIPDKKFIEAEVKIHWAFVHLKFGHYFKSFWSLKQAYAIAEENQKLFPSFIPNQKSLGILHTIFGAFPDNYNWVLSIMNLEGDVSKGLNELDHVIQASSIFSEETLIYKSLFQGFLLNQKETAVTALERYDGNKHSSTKLVHAILLIKNAESEKAKSEFLSLQKKSDGRLSTTNYFLGEIYLQSLSYDSSIYYYRKFIESSKGQNYLKDAWTKIAINQWLQGNQNYKESLVKAQNTGLTNTEIDKNAAELIKYGLPDKTLLKIRYTSDGGYFDKTQEIIDAIDESDFKEKKDKVEFTYRKARYFHKINQLQKAKTCYQSVIDADEIPGSYFAPNSSLQLGYILLEEKDTTKARTYFEKARTYKSHPYKYSIDKKAELELEVIGE